jgi:hypothetical protein
MPLGDAVAVTSDERAEIGAILDIRIQVVVTQHHVAHLSVLVRHFEGNDDPAVSHDAGFDAVVIAQRVNIHRLAVGRRAKRLFGI